MINVADELTYQHIMYTIITKNTFLSVQHAPKKFPNLQIRKATRYLPEQVSYMSPTVRPQMFHRKMQDVTELLDDILPKPSNVMIHKQRSTNWPILLRKKTSFSDLFPNNLMPSGHYQHCKATYTKCHLLRRAYTLPSDSNPNSVESYSMEPHDSDDAIEKNLMCKYRSILIRPVQGLRDILSFLHHFINNSNPWQYMISTYYIINVWADSWLFLCRIISRIHISVCMNIYISVIIIVRETF